MHERLRHIIIDQKASIRQAMERIGSGAKQMPPSPWGMAIIMEQDRMIGIVTDGDIRRAILQGKSLEDPIAGIMIRDPLCIHQGSPREMLSELHEQFRLRGGDESRYHQVLVVDEGGGLVDAVTPFELWRQSDVGIKNVAIVGMGFVGLTLALTLNEFGIRVTGVDTNPEVLVKLRLRTPLFFEKGIDKLLKKHANGLLTLKQQFDGGESDIYVICVGTPVDEHGRIITSHLEAAVQQVGRVLKPHDLVILRSTVPIGTCRNTAIPILERISGLRTDRDFFLAFAPERTVEGKALEELRTLPQIIGGSGKQSTNLASQFFRIFAHTIVTVDSLEEAEAVKLLNNTFRDLSFSFANEAAQICDGFHLNARRVIRAANEGYIRDPIPYPSPGVGGTCLVKDPHLLVESARRVRHDSKLPLMARAINESMIDFVVCKVDTFIERTGKDPAHVALFLMGIAFKGAPETSDIRHSTAVEILRKLRHTYDHITIYDPVAHREDLQTLGVHIVDSPDQGFRDRDGVLVLNNHPSYADLDIFTLAGTMRRPGLLFDPWGAYSQEQLSELEDVHYAGL